jgi:hypothetical protein
MKKLSLALFAIAALAVILGLAVGSGIPYQDATPEMIAKEKLEAARGMRCFIVAGVAVALGAVTYLISTFKRSN